MYQTGFLSRLFLCVTFFSFLSPIPLNAQDQETSHAYWRALQKSSHYVEGDLSPAKEVKVRMGVRLDFYERWALSGLEGKKDVKSRLVRTIKEVLRVHLTKMSHFYFDGYHVQTIPDYDEKEDGSFLLTVVVFRRYGKSGALEEKLGSFKIPGELDDKDQEVSSFQGDFGKTLKDSLGYPKLSLRAMSHEKIRGKKS